MSVSQAKPDKKRASGEGRNKTGELAVGSQKRSRARV